MNAVNMDTGYVNYLSDAEKRDVLRWTLGKMYHSFLALASKTNQAKPLRCTGERWMSLSAPAVFPSCSQTSRLYGKSGKEKTAIYQEVCRGYTQVLAFELGKMFAPNGEILDQETFRA